MRKNIYHIDSIFKTFGVLSLVLGGMGFMLLPFDWGIPFIRILMVVSGVFLIIAGFQFAKKEKRIIALWDALELSGEAKVDDLSKSLGMHPSFIIHHLKVINEQQGVYYVLKGDKIVDGRLMGEFFVAEKCNGCGAGVNAKVPLSADMAPDCEFCGAPVFDIQTINDYKFQILSKPNNHVAQAKPKFNMAVFITLMIFFWPAGLFYAFMRGGLGLNKLAGDALKDRL